MFDTMIIDFFISRKRTRMTSFQPGETLSVKCKNSIFSMRNGYCTFVPEFETFTGAYMTSPVWQKIQAINLATGDAFFPMRALAMTDVVEIRRGSEIVPVPLPMASDHSVKTWTINGFKNQVYTITEENGRRTCTCLGFNFRRACKHLDARPIQ